MCHGATRREGGGGGVRDRMGRKRRERRRERNEADEGRYMLNSHS